MNVQAAATTPQIQIGWHDAVVAIDTPIPAAGILQTQAIERAVAHLAIERGARKARRSAWNLVRLLRRIQAQASVEAIEIHVSNQITAPPTWDVVMGIGVEVRGVTNHRIVWDLCLYGGIEGKGFWAAYGQAMHSNMRSEWKTWSRTDVVLRQIAK